METLAYLYVNYIEPGSKIFAFILIVFGVIWFINIARDYEKLTDIANKTLTYTYTFIKLFFTYFGLALWGTFMFFVRLVRVTFATLRDFFISRI